MIQLIAILTVFVVTNAENINYLNDTNYGPYILEWKKFEVCSGPKARNLTNVSIRFYSDSGEFNVTYLQPTPLDLIKVNVINIVNDRRIELFSYKIMNPCGHMVVSPFIRGYVGSKCIMKKGTISTYLNFTQLFQSFLHTKFFYGNFLLKVVVLSKKGNIMCVLMYVDINQK